MHSPSGATGVGAGSVRFKLFIAHMCEEYKRDFTKLGAIPSFVTPRISMLPILATANVNNGCSQKFLLAFMSQGINIEVRVLIFLPSYLRDRSFMIWVGLVHDLNL